MNILPPNNDADNGHPRNPSKDQSNKSLQQVCEPNVSVRAPSGNLFLH